MAIGHPYASSMISQMNLVDYQYRSPWHSISSPFVTSPTSPLTPSWLHQNLTQKTKSSLHFLHSLRYSVVLPFTVIVSVLQIHFPQHQWPPQRDRSSSLGLGPSVLSVRNHFSRSLLLTRHFWQDSLITKNSGLCHVTAVARGNYNAVHGQWSFLLVGS